MAVAFHNSKDPYIFINCRTKADFMLQYSIQKENQNSDNIDEVSYITYDSTNNYIVVSLVSQKIEIYQIL